MSAAKQKPTGDADRILCSLAVAFLLAIVLTTTTLARTGQHVEGVAWRPLEIELHSQSEHSWWGFPVEVVWECDAEPGALRVKAFWDGPNTYRCRFAPPTAGAWTYRSESEDPALVTSGRITVREASAAELQKNPNLRGHLRTGPTQRLFEYADGTPCLLLADTLWAGNTVRCGLGKNESGPFYQYLSNRQAKGFNAVLMRYLYGFGDEPDHLNGHRNEGGYTFAHNDRRDLNAGYFKALDRRIEAITDRGMIPITPVTWWGKTRDKQCPIELKWARRISGYLAVRYGAYNGVWSLSGEYQYAFRDCDWRADDFDKLGEIVSHLDSQGHPLSIHPSSQLYWPSPHNQQSSLAFNDSAWLDHHWLQTGQDPAQLHNIVSRAKQVRAVQPTRPVFCSEAYYETASDPEHAYHSRWQVWTAVLNGCAGYGYGAWGIWQFYDPDDVEGETGKNVKTTVPWQQSIDLAGSSQVGLAREILESVNWSRLEPDRDAVLVNGTPPPMPSADNLSPPHCARDGHDCFLIYVPKGNESNVLALGHHPEADYRLTWINPRDGSQLPAIRWSGAQEGQLPERPNPTNGDWLVVLRRQAG